MVKEPKMVKSASGSRPGNLFKVRVPLAESEWGPDLKAETLWAERVSPGRYLIRNTPFYAYGISAQDVVNATDRDGVLTFTGIARRGGHSTYRILLPEDGSVKSRGFLRHWKPLRDLGCSYEVAKRRWISVDVPPKADINKVYDLLEEGLNNGYWTFDEGHCGHRVKAEVLD